MAEKELTEGAKKVLDEANEFVCGFCSLQILDQDGYVKKQKGSNIEAPLHFQSADGDSVVLEAVFPLSPLFFLQITNEEGNFLFGRCWIGEGSWSRTGQLCTLIPKDTQSIANKLEGAEFMVDAEMPFLQNSTTRLLKVKVGVKEQRFVTKVVSCTLSIPKADWLEWKQYRLKLWRSSKSWAGVDKNEEKEKKEKEEKDDD
eukprot:CAMPEP_0117502692 /NCGR_PEP_ID=MMETSP0784-20121206/23942_1 /TAXON_ID=39447 /ORGANISM="" /LENGTH=200 /DNA_ID=CAMNT_0005297979 /DNA_START=85 /DNA_END=687 /DNA_ORIENTATION=-